jgi:hypothetical protein
MTTTKLEKNELLPNLIIIGAMKCGTVSLHRYLSLHPDIAMSPIDELDFFVEEKNWHRGLEWYSSHFKRSAKIVGERSTGYTKFPTFKGVPEKMFNLIPDAKLIYCIRDPIDRIVSQYVHWIARGYENRPFNKAVIDNFPENPYIQYSRYYMQVEQYLKYFVTSQIYILHLEQLAHNRRETLRSIFRFLEVDPEIERDEFDNVFHQSKNLKQSTWFRKQFGSMRGMVRLEKIAPMLFKRSIRRPQVSEQMREKLLEVLNPEMNQVKLEFEEPRFAQPIMVQKLNQ